MTSLIKQAPGMFTSLPPHWATPKGLYDELDGEFHFTLDPCPLNDKSDWSGLVIEWTGSVFVNPPYGRHIGEWIAKGFASAQAGATVVMLIPSRTDTRWWHDYVMKGEIRFIKGRLHFNDGTGPSPFPSCIVVFTHD